MKKKWLLLLGLCILIVFVCISVVYMLFAVTPTVINSPAESGNHIGIMGLGVMQFLIGVAFLAVMIGILVVLYIFPAAGLLIGLVRVIRHRKISRRALILPGVLILSSVVLWNMGTLLFYGSEYYFHHDFGSKVYNETYIIPYYESVYDDDLELVEKKVIDSCNAEYTLRSGITGILFTVETNYNDYGDVFERLQLSVDYGTVLGERLQSGEEISLPIDESHTIRMGETFCWFHVWEYFDEYSMHLSGDINYDQKFEGRIWGDYLISYQNDVLTFKIPTGKLASQTVSTHEFQLSTQTNAPEIQEGQQMFDAPENVIKEYLAGLRDNDMERMLGSFAENGYMKSDVEVGQEPAPLNELREQNTEAASLDFYQRITAENNEDNVVSDILRQYMILCDIEIDTRTPIWLNEDGDAKKLYNHMRERMETTDFNSMKLLGFVSQELLIDVVGADQYNKYSDSTAGLFGADKVEIHQCIIELDGNKYSLNFDVAEYDGQWQILRLGGYQASMSMPDNSVAGTERLDAEDERVYEQEYERLIVPKGDLPPAALYAPVEPPAAWESTGFDTPQESVKAYLEGIKAFDLERTISTFAVESFVDHYDMQRDLEFIKTYSFMEQHANLPVVNKLSRDVNIRTRKRNIIEDIAKQYQALCFINGKYFGNASLIDEKEPADILQNQQEMARSLKLDTMEILGYIPPEDIIEKYTSEANKELLNQRAQQFGAEQAASGMVVFELQGNKYYICVDILKYKGRWYNWQLGGQLVSFLGIDQSFKGIWLLDSFEETELEPLIIPMETSQ